MTLKTCSQSLGKLIPLIILASLVLNPYPALITSGNLEVQDPPHSLYGDKFNIIKLPLVIGQENTTDTTNTTTPTTTSTTGDTNTTTVAGRPGPWNPILDPGLYFPLALVFSILGIFSAIWLIFFVETSQDRTIRERLIGSTIRLVTMSILLGLAIHFWLLFEPI
ncbi:MAG: hypothetical protein ACFFE8_14805 [Candidatus Heimdallarchaeota archaeon]